MIPIKSIILSIDKNVKIVSRVFIISLLENSRDYRLKFTIIIDDIETRQYLENFFASLGFFKVIYFYQNDLLNVRLKIDQADHVTVATYNRIFVLPYLPQGVLHYYFDIDMLVVRNLNKLFDLSFTEVLAGVKHFDAREELRLFGHNNASYFNAGLLIINAIDFSLIDIYNKLIEVLQLHWERILWHDQDVLNIAFENEWHPIGVEFNVTYAVSNLYKKYEDVIIYHYDGAYKPWRSSVRRDSYLWRDFAVRHNLWRFPLVKKMRFKFSQRLHLIRLGVKTILGV